jgi:NAD(P)-dependent dehydrogenase (short-subunit alcohol dehydrogenase family)
MKLEGKIALVTGGAVRVGRAISKELLKNGTRLYCHYYRSETQAKKLKAEFPQVQLLKGDLSVHNTGKMLIDQIIKDVGRIDILVNNAAIFIKTPFGEITEEDWDKHFNLNLKAGFFLAQAAGKNMLNIGNGKIINIADTSGLSPWPSYLPYSLAKSGVISMTKGLAKVLAPNVQVNGINPGPVYLPPKFSSAQREKAVARTLLKREGKAQDIANAVRFLIEDGDYITGTILSVDGGRSLS